MSIKQSWSTSDGSVFTTEKEAVWFQSLPDINTFGTFYKELRRAFSEQKFLSPQLQDVDGNILKISGIILDNLDHLLLLNANCIMFKSEGTQASKLYSIIAANYRIETAIAKIFKDFNVNLDDVRLIKDALFGVDINLNKLQQQVKSANKQFKTSNASESEKSDRKVFIVDIGGFGNQAIWNPSQEDVEQIVKLFKGAKLNNKIQHYTNLGCAWKEVSKLDFEKLNGLVKKSDPTCDEISIAIAGGSFYKAPEGLEELYKFFKVNPSFQLSIGNKTITAKANLSKNKTIEIEIGDDEYQPSDAEMKQFFEFFKCTGKTFLWIIDDADRDQNVGTLVLKRRDKRCNKRCNDIDRNNWTSANKKIDELTSKHNHLIVENAKLAERLSIFNNAVEVKGITFEDFIDWNDWPSDKKKPATSDLEELKVGDVVHLKSGGPRMTISAIYFTSKTSAECVWFDENNNVFDKTVSIEALKKA